MGNSPQPLYLQDRITLRNAVSLRASDVKKLRTDYNLPNAMKWTFTRTEQVWDPISGSLDPTPREIAHYREDDVFAAFVDLASIGMPLMEKLSATLGDATGGWRLRFAGVLLMDPQPWNPKVLHTWQIPSYDSLWRMMDALREELWYILLQGFVDTEEQELLRDASHPAAVVPYAKVPNANNYLVSSQRIWPIEYLSVYGDVGDYLDLAMKKAGGGIVLRGTITTGTLGEMQRIYAAPAEATTAVAQQSAEMAILFDALRLAHHNEERLPPDLREQLKSVPEIVTQFWPFVVETNVEIFQRLLYDHPEA